MKILIITLEYPPQVGGIASYVKEYAAHRAPEDVLVLAPEAKGAAEYDATNPWKVIRAKPFYAFIWPHWLRLFLKARSIIKKEGVTEVHVHQILPVGYVAYFLKKLNPGLSYTVFLHGTDVALALQQKRKARWFTKLCSVAAKVVVNSRYLEGRVSDHVGATPVTVVHPCPSEAFLASVPENELTKLQAHLALSGKKVVLTVGRMIEGKGFPHCVSILSKIIEKVPNVVWIMVGNGPKRNTIISLVQKHNLQNAVRFLGEVPHEQLPTLYQAADAFVLLTHPDGGVEESWGTVLLEAAASGVPVVVGRAGGVVEAVEGGVTGLVVDTYQTEQVVSAITEILTDEAKATSLGAAGKARVAEEFTWSKQLAKL